MTMHDQRFDRTLPELFVELASARTPDYLEAAIEQASSRPQRPAWTYPGRWLPVQITTQAVPPARVPWRQLGTLALIALLLAALAVAYIGSRRAPSPAPLYGLAGNGQIALEQNGDIVAVDLVTGKVTPLVIGPTKDRSPAYSRDGTRLAFVRAAEGFGGDLIMIANADGSNVIQATREPVGLTWWSFSPDGQQLLIAGWSQNRGVPKVAILAADASGTEMAIDVPLPPNVEKFEPPSYRPHHENEILVVGYSPETHTRGIFIADAATGKQLRTVVEPAADTDICSASWSSTGDAINYCSFMVEGNGGRAQLRLVSHDGTGDRALPYDWSASAWSNDGTRLVVGRGPTPDDAAERMQVATVGSDATPLDLACEVGTDSTPGTCADDWVWSPDDTVLIGSRTAPDGIVRYFKADPVSGSVSELGWTGVGMPAWQRIAPEAP
jgi:dipeptidyl aminopeptidase/acylaminoacyl peptidase